MTPTTLITGGAGFLGSHLADRLIADGQEVLCVDNFYTGSKDSIRHLLGHERFELIRHDIWLPFSADSSMSSAMAMMPWAPTGAMGKGSFSMSLVIRKRP